LLALHFPDVVSPKKMKSDRQNAIETSLVLGKDNVLPTDSHHALETANHNIFAKLLQI
jgi:hypothetical protein